MHSMITKSAIKTWRVPGIEAVEFVTDEGYPESRAHMHRDSTLDVIESGTVEYTVRNRKFVAAAGSLVWIRRYEVHGSKAIGKKRVTYKSIFLPDSFIHQITEIDVSKETPLVIATNSDPLLFQKFLRVHKKAELTEAGCVIEMEIVAGLQQLLRPAESRKSLKLTDIEHRAVRAIKEYLLAHYNEPIRILPMAKTAGLNPFYLTRLFKNIVGVTPYEYLTELRIAHARNFLADGMRPADVAAEVGLSDQSHLNRFFKRSTGMTPGYFRTSDFETFSRDAAAD